MSRPGDRLHKIEGRIWGESEKAIKFQVEMINGNVLTPVIEWFPFSQVKSIDRRTPGSDEYDALQVSEWILEKKNLERYIGKTVVHAAGHATKMTPDQLELAREAAAEYRVNTFDDMDDDIPF